MTYILSVLYHFLDHLDIDESIKSKLARSFTIVFTYMANLSSNTYINEVRSNKAAVWSSVYMVRDTILTATNDKRCFQLIMNKLYQIDGFRSAYIYLYDDVPVQMTTGFWQVPKYVLLQSYCKDGKIRVLEGDNRILPSYMIFRNKNTPNERRVTMILTPIFTNEVRHGMFLCETDLSNFSKIYSTSLRLGTSLKFISLMRQEMAIQNRLESTMNEIERKERSFKCFICNR